LIISVASGKGGTGKTTIAVNLAGALQKDVVLLDCDVEEPNCHLFLKPKMNGRETVFAAVPKIDESKCTYCKKCSEICRFKAIAVLKNMVMVFEELCHSCGGCMAVCPENAITETGRTLGEIEQGQQGLISFVHGCLRVGEAMSPPLIRKVRSYIQPDKINIIDAPPGTSCPVIAATKEVDFVLMVTEPTPFGLHDLKLAVEGVKLLDIPCGIVINRSDIGDDHVRSYADKEHIPVLMEIPFDRRIAEVYSTGGLLIEEMPEWKDKFMDLYQKIESSIK